VSDKFNDFVRGQADCRNGVEHKSGQSKSYDEGYSAEYQMEQIVSHQAEQGCRFARARA